MAADIWQFYWATRQRRTTYRVFRTSLQKWKEGEMSRSPFEQWISRGRKGGKVMKNGEKEEEGEGMNACGQLICRREK